MNPEWMAISLAAALFLAMLGLFEVGYRIGRHRRAVKEDGEASDGGAGVIEAAVFTLLGLLVAFQFSGAASRLDARRQIVVQEANAIGTAYLRLDLLPAEDQNLLREMFRRYADFRIKAFENVHDWSAHTAAVEAANGLQGQIWTQAVAASRKGADTRATMLVVPALNDMIDITTTREVSAWTHAPWLVVGLLLAIAGLSAMMAGLTMSASPSRSVLHALVFAAVTAITLYVILDMEFPRVGLIRIGPADQAMRDARAAMR